MKKAMKIKLLALLVVVSTTVLSCRQGSSSGTENENENESSTAEAKTYHVSLSESTINWKGSMLGVYSHGGTIGLKSAVLSVAGGKVTSGEFTVDMGNIITTDDDALYKVFSREKFIGHMHSDDFFAVATNPTSTFVVKSTEGNTIKGDLTVRGITHEESVTDVVIVETDGQITATGKLVFDRKKYNVNYDNKTGDMVIGNDIELDITLKGTE